MNKSKIVCSPIKSVSVKNHFIILTLPTRYGKTGIIQNLGRAMTVRQEKQFK